MNRPEVHEVLARWRALSEPRSERPVLIGETWVHDLESLMRFYGTGSDELHMAFNFVFLLAEFDAATLAPIVARTDELLPGEAWPVWTLGNHDVTRYPTRWAHDDPARVRTALMLLLTLRGTPILYYGDELGMAQADVPPERRRDPVGQADHDAHAGRDGARTPMPWTAQPGGGFTLPGVEPWLPFGDLTANVADQREDPSSVLHLSHDLIALRRTEDDLRGGAYEQLPAPAGAWAFRRGERIVVALNLSDEEVEVEGVEGAIAVGTRRERDGERVQGSLGLGPWEGAVVRAGAAS
jgi:alpha-glucosidase